MTINAPKIELINSLKINLNSNERKTLNPVLVNSSNDHPVFIYSSSNETIATVDSNGVVTAHQVGECVITVKLSSNNEVSATCNVSVTREEVKELDYTLMFYMCGSDLEYSTERGYENTHLFTEDIQEILSVKNIPDSVKIIIETGGSKKWFMPQTYLEGATSISSSELQRWEVNNKTNKLTLVETLSTNNMASENSFTEFLNWGLDDYSAKQMGVIISGHGGGLAGCAYDDNYTYNYGGSSYQHTLRSFEIANAAKNALENSSKEKFTWIGYDCCLMQCADIASLNADYFEYMVGSQELEDGYGWDHDVYLPLIKNDPSVEPMTLLPKICDSFVDFNCKNGGCGKNDPDDSTLSVIDLSKMPAFTSEFNSYVSKIVTSKTPFSNVKKAFIESYNDFGEKIYGLCDFKSLLISLDKYFPSYSTQSVRDALSEIVVYNVFCDQYDSSDVCGVNAFFPVSLDKKYDLQVGKEDYSSSATKFTYWQQLCYQSDGYVF